MKKKKEEKEFKQIDEQDIQNMSEDEIKDLLAKNRKDIAKSFKEVFDGIITIRDEEPDEDFIKKAQEDYEKAVKDFQDATYEIYSGDRALEVAKFLQEWNAKCNRWERQAWKGVIAFNDIITKKVQALEEEGAEQKVILEYAPLVFIYGSMLNPSGVGLEAAQLMETLETDPSETNDDTAAVTYTNILEWIGRKVDGFEAVQAKIQALQERWTMAASGFAFDFVSDEPEIYVQFMEKARMQEQQPKNIKPEK